ncbi:hypothetical protein EZBTHKR_1989 [Elizabethkingia anophelis]|nr:hypothetical protein EZBTHKR_1989 [Elizabethkingia anophelis]
MSSTIKGLRAIALGGFSIDSLYTHPYGNRWDFFYVQK